MTDLVGLLLVSIPALVALLIAAFAIRQSGNTAKAAAEAAEKESLRSEIITLRGDIVGFKAEIVGLKNEITSLRSQNLQLMQTLLKQNGGSAL